MQRTIAILGAGFSGTAAAVRLLGHGLGAELRIVMLERSGPAHRGVAYRTWDDNLLLNVPAGNMSALADDPGHFVAYIRNIDPNFNSGSFIPRRIYGEYLEDTVRAAQRDSASVLETVDGEAVAVRPMSPTAGFAVDLADGRVIAADQVLLAFGHSPPADPLPESGLSTLSSYVADPWDLSALDRIHGERPVALLGAGHTAIDTLFRLASRSERRKFFLLSRRGLLPHGHRLTPHQPVPVALPAYLALQNGASARGYLHAIRQEARRRAAAGDDWRDVVNELRPHTPELWRRLPALERGRFLDRLAPYWDVHRHRLAPSAYLRLQRMVSSGQVKQLAGRVVSIRSSVDSPVASSVGMSFDMSVDSPIGTSIDRSADARAGDIRIVMRRRLDGATSAITVGALVNCTGANADISKLTHPLLVQLREQGLVRQDPMKLGLEVDERYQVIGRDGRAVHNLFYLGPMLKAQRWEATAVPELRTHCAHLVRQMLD
jgi:uncharacterized NAD(P)/FAD-binding protein YdhS